MNSPAGAGGSSPLGSWVSTLPSPLLPGWMLPCEQQPRVGKKDGGELFPIAIPEKSSRSRYFDPKMFGVFPPPPSVTEIGSRCRLSKCRKSCSYSRVCVHVQNILEQVFHFKFMSRLIPEYFPRVEEHLAGVSACCRTSDKMDWLI